MHGRSGAAGRTCLDRTPSIGTRVLSSVSAFGVCSFALGAQHVPIGETGCRLTSLVVCVPVRYAGAVTRCSDRRSKIPK
eukprot:6339569-Prymnesium_polylepis.1